CLADGELQRRSAGYTRTRHAERMTERDGAAIGVHMVAILRDAEFTQYGNALACKCLIELDDIKIFRRQSQPGAEPLRRRRGTDPHDAWRDTGGRAAQDAGNRGEAVSLCR